MLIDYKAAKENIIVLVFSLTSFMSLYVFSLGESRTIIFRLFIILSILVFFLKINVNVKYSVALMMYFIIKSIFFKTIIFDGRELFVILLFGLPVSTLIRIATWYVKILVYIFAAGLFIFALKYFINISPFDTLYHDSPLKQASKIYYDNYYLLVQGRSEIAMYDVGLIHRFHSVFDEPGMVGTICSFLLFVNYKYIDNPVFSKVIIIVSGILSASTMFLISFLVYLSYMIIKRYSLLFAFIFVSCLLALYGVYNADIIVSLFHEVIQSDNRISACAWQYLNNEVYIDENIIFWGNGIGAFMKTGCDGASILLKSSDQGIIFTVTDLTLLIAFLVLFSFKHNNIPTLATGYYMLLIVLNLYQRPYIFHPLIIVPFFLTLIKRK